MSSGALQRRFYSEAGWKRVSVERHDSWPAATTWQRANLQGVIFDVYAAGLDATSLRTMLAYKSKKRSWQMGVTDIRQAFVLAPWIGKPVALRPPSLAVDLGLAEPDDYWLVLQSIYGLRESPAAWAAYRDGQLKAARWHARLENEEVELRLEQLVSDNQVWRIVRADGKRAKNSVPPCVYRRFDGGWPGTCYAIILSMAFQHLGM